MCEIFSEMDQHFSGNKTEIKIQQYERRRTDTRENSIPQPKDCEQCNKVYFLSGPFSQESLVYLTNLSLEPFL